MELIFSLRCGSATSGWMISVIKCPSPPNWHRQFCLVANRS